MCMRDSLLLQLLRLVDSIPEPPPPSKRRRGRPLVYSDRLFLKVLLLMMLRRLHRVHEVVSVLAQPGAEIAEIRALLFPRGEAPSRRTFERRLSRLPATLPAQIAALGAYLVRLYRPWEHSGRAVAIDSTALRARGAPWHKRDRAAGVVPHSNIDTEAHWTRSGWHGWVYGWKLHLVTTVAAIWIPLAAELRPAHEADSTVAPDLLAHLPAEVRFVLGDSHYSADNVRAACEAHERILVAATRKRTRSADDGTEVRRILHSLRYRSIEPFNSLFKNIFDVHRVVPTRHLFNTQRFALGAVLLYQIVLLYRHQRGELHQQGIKALIRSA